MVRIGRLRGVRIDASIIRLDSLTGKYDLIVPKLVVRAPRGIIFQPESGWGVPTTGATIPRKRLTCYCDFPAGVDLAKNPNVIQGGDFLQFLAQDNLPVGFEGQYPIDDAIAMVPSYIIIYLSRIQHSARQ